jgi:hypothetical protein
MAASHANPPSWRPFSLPSAEQIPDDRKRRDQQHAHDDAAADAVQCPRMPPMRANIGSSAQ